MFPKITEEVLNNQDFKEDSVRELIIAPMITKLGYGPVGENKVVRSKALQNPFIRVGTRNHPITTIPDYTFYVDDKPLLTLDAKAPSEDILKDCHIQQAYSYAVHPEIRCDHFALCNGRELGVFEISSPKPILHLKFERFESDWKEIEKFLSPRYLREPILRLFAPDFGFALKQMGISSETELTFLGVRLNLFGKVSDSLFTASCNCDFGTGDHAASFDFQPELLPAILSGLPKELSKRFTEALNNSPFQAAAGLHVEIDIKAQLGEETQGQFEIFIPLIIKDIIGSRFNIFDVPPPEEDTTPHNIFKLREAFKINEIKVQ